VVAVISADDPDDGDNACLSYTITSGNDDDLFEVVTPGEGRIAVKRSLLGATKTRRLFTLGVDISDGGVPPLRTTAILKILLDASLPFAPAQKRYVVVNNGGTMVLVLCSLSSAMFILLVTAALLLHRFAAADRKQDGRRQTGTGSSRPSRLVRSALARYRRRRAERKRSLARDVAAARDFARSHEEELSSLSGASSERRATWDVCHAHRSTDDTILPLEDNTSAIIIVNDNIDHQLTSSAFFRV